MAGDGSSVAVVEVALRAPERFLVEPERGGLVRKPMRRSPAIEGRSARTESLLTPPPAPPKRRGAPAGTSPGERVCSEEHVPGSREAPLEPRDIDDKFTECFGLGVNPLSGAQIAALSERANALETLTDMTRFFDGIARPE